LSIIKAQFKIVDTTLLI